jgi:stress-induced morphogen
MSVEIRGQSDQDLQSIAEALEEYQENHAQAEIVLYRQNSVSVRVRIIDPSFTAVSRADRHDLVWDFLAEKLPEDVLTQITVLLLLSPQDSTMSFANFEFDHPIPSRL